MTRKQPFDDSDLAPVEPQERVRLRDGADDARVEWALSEVQRNEFDRRMKEYGRDPDSAETWEEVRDEIMRDLAEESAPAAGATWVTGSRAYIEQTEAPHRIPVRGLGPSIVSASARASVREGDGGRGGGVGA